MAPTAEPTAEPTTFAKRIASAEEYVSEKLGGSSIASKMKDLEDVMSNVKQSMNLQNTSLQDLQGQLSGLSEKLYNFSSSTGTSPISTPVDSVITDASDNESFQSPTISPNIATRDIEIINQSVEESEEFDMQFHRLSKTLENLISDGQSALTSPLTYDDDLKPLEMYNFDESSSIYSGKSSPLARNSFPSGVAFDESVIPYDGDTGLDVSNSHQSTINQLNGKRTLKFRRRITPLSPVDTDSPQDYLRRKYSKSPPLSPSAHTGSPSFDNSQNRNNRNAAITPQGGAVPDFANLPSDVPFNPETQRLMNRIPYQPRSNSNDDEPELPELSDILHIKFLGLTLKSWLYICLFAFWFGHLRALVMTIFAMVTLKLASKKIIGWVAEVSGDIAEMIIKENELELQRKINHQQQQYQKRNRPTGARRNVQPNVAPIKTVQI
ncbi:hypothetical protein BKA69DRAFT_1128350 [Paraphysoderma sedebokerense]|nr:hypothetical protein BKA69DRAFT_1128350 [Paraphysoderma sedebokerense]